MLNPETITVLDPACGSGHILVEAYDLLKAIYLEHGYPLRSIPRLILEKNLYGLDIDDRAAQLAGFALLMKARADDRRLLDNPPQLNVLAIQASNNLNVQLLWQQLDLNRQSQLGTTSSLFTDPQTDLTQAIDDSQYQRINNTLALFAQAQALGSLIQIPAGHLEPLQDLLAQCQTLASQGDNFQKTAATTLLPFIRQAVILAMQFDVVVANPPYMGGKGMNPALKEFAKRTFPDSKSDLLAMFMERGFEWCKPTGFNSMVTMQSWMFLSSYQAMREKLLGNKTINTMAHLGARAFSEISGEVVQTTAFVFHGDYFSGYKPAFFRLVDGNEEQKQTDLRSGKNRFDKTVQEDFKKISGSPVAYWVSDKVRDVFENSPALSEVADARQGLATTDNDRFLRLWHEIDINRIGFGFANSLEAQKSGFKWFPYNKGGVFRKWYGNQDFVVNWENDGEEIKNNILEKYPYLKTPDFVAKNQTSYFHTSVGWSKVTSGTFSMRFFPTGFIFADAGMSIFCKDSNQLMNILGILNSQVSLVLLSNLSPTLNFEAGTISKFPLNSEILDTEKTQQCIELAKTDWNNYETSWDFDIVPTLQRGNAASDAPASRNAGALPNAFPRQSVGTIKAAFEQWQTQNRAAIAKMQHLEEENNRLFIEAYGLQDELSPDVPEEQITLTRADREKDCQRLISYAIGCMMGRYSLAEPGLIYAHAGNVDFNPDRYPSFPADADGIVPITDELWFEDDAANRLNEFLLAVWGAETKDENLAWLAANLGQKPTETAQETLRRYLASHFYKNHLQTYKKRPIYWLFTSGKQGAFQALVYLHRYQESTLARMRAEYVVPLTGKIQARIDMLEKDAAAAVANATRSKLNKDIEKLKKKHVELLAYDEKLRHYADLRIPLDLDDGVKVNYGKFGDLLAEVKAVTGGSGDD
jgi:type II restriction/modification system DNA methylase subunit YeeA